MRKENSIINSSIGNKVNSNNRYKILQDREEEAQDALENDSNLAKEEENPRTRQRKNQNRNCIT